MNNSYKEYASKEFVLDQIANVNVGDDILELINKLDDDKLDASELTNAVNDTLAQAKASGEFDGKTPVKGVDYYTESDKTEIVNAVIEALPTWEGGSF